MTKGGMAMDLRLIGQLWARERADYDRLCCDIQARLRDLFRANGILAEVTYRTKETGSLLKKVLRKRKDRPSYDYADVKDKAGLRVIVASLSERETAHNIIMEAFDNPQYDDKSESLGTDRVGYTSIHYDLQIPDSVSGEVRCVELQLRTLGQHLWAEMTHRLVYKRDLHMPPELSRRTNCLAALMEIVDHEFEEVRSRVYSLPERDVYDVLTFLEMKFLRFYARDIDYELSHEILTALKPLWGNSGTEELKKAIEVFWEHDHEALERIYDKYALDVYHFPLLSQPESILMLYLLHSDRFALRETWEQHFPLDELESLASLFGTPYSDE